jgi:FixJ family two-component response regulator
MTARTEPMVFLVEDDRSYQRALQRLLNAARLPVKAFGSAEEFLSCPEAHRPGCLLLDMSLPGASGMDLVEMLHSVACRKPVVFLTGHGDIPMSVRAMKAGAVDFLTKPVEAGVLLAAIKRAFDVDAAKRQTETECDLAEDRYQSLSPREKEVFALIVKGNLNKQTAFDLGTTERTIKAHRARIMEKMRVDSLAALVRAAEKLKSCGAFEFKK